MHKATKSLWSKTAGVLMTVLLAISSFTLASSSNASLTAQPLDFVTVSEIKDLAVGHSPVIYEDIVQDISGNTTRAKIEVTSIQNMCPSDLEVTSANWQLDWRTFHTQSDTAGGYRVKYEFNNGTPVYYPPLADQAFSAATTSTSITGLTQTTDRDDHVFTVIKYTNTNPNGTEVGLASTAVLTNSSSRQDDRAYHGPLVCPGGIQKLNRLDQASITASLDRLLDVSIQRDDNSVESFATIKISFEESASPHVPQVFSYLSVNVYDLDFRQFLEVENITSYQLDDPTNIASVTRNGSVWRFDAGPDGLGGVDSFTKGRVQLNFANVSTITIKFGLPNSGSGSGSFDVDFSDGAALAPQAWTPTSGPAPSTNAVVVSSGGSSGIQAPVVTLLSPLASAIVPSNRNVSLLGVNFDKVTEVYVAGKKVKIRKQTPTQIDIRLPKGLSGLVDLELKSTLNNVLSPKHFNLGGVASVQTRKAELIVGGFDHNSRKLTARMKARIDRWLDRNSDLATLTCTGFTSLPRRTTDVELSTNRGITACEYAKGQRADVTSTVSQGIEDPRPGSNVRRVRLVLTP